jgi:hypothetical protein
MNSLIADALQTGIVTLVVSKIAKGIGEKDLAEIIYASGMCVVGIDVVLMLKPITKAISGFMLQCDGILQKLDSIGKGIGGLLH